MLDFKQQLQYAYVNERPKKFEELIEKTIDDINTHIIDLTQRNIFEVIIVMNRKGYSGDLDSILQNDYKTDIEERDLTAFYVSMEDEEMLGFSDKDLMDAIYDYYEDQGMFLQAKDKSRHIHFKMNWKSIIKERQESFTEAELLFEDFVDAIKLSDRQYSEFVESMKPKVKEYILQAAKNHQTNFELKICKLNSDVTECRFDQYIIYCDKYIAIQLLTVDISDYLESLNIGVSVGDIKSDNIGMECILRIDLSNLYNLH